MPQLIDVQTHYIPPPVVEALERRTEWPRIVKEGDQRLIHYGDNTAYPLIREMIDLETKIEAMDKAGIAMSVLSVNIPGLDYFDVNDVEAIARDTNDVLADEIARRPDRFAALATLPLRLPEAAAAELERAMALGLNGVMVYSNVAGSSLDEPEFRPVFEAAAGQDAAILIHPTYPRSSASVAKHELVSVFGYMFDTATAALDLILDGLYNRHPDFKLILPHAGSVVPYLVGRLDYEGAICHGEGFTELDAPPSEYLKRLYVDTVTGYPPALKYVIDYLGADHVLYATDHPFWDPAWTNEALAKVDMTEEERQAIEYGNARRLLAIGAPA